MKFSEYLENKLNEAKINPKDKKEFQKYAKEIVEKVIKSGIKDDKQLHILVWKIMSNMALGNNNPNYKNTEKYMPKSFNKELFDNGDKNTYESVWFSMTDSQQDTIVRKAIKQAN